MHRISRGFSAPAAYEGAWPGHAYFPSPADWRTLPVYQLITDRFADGDPTNNGIWPWSLDDYDVRDMTRRHGGDFKGILEKLDYIHSLGCRCVWISPIFQNGYNDYHGYSQEDFTLIDKRMGSLADLRALTDAAHARGMYIFIDIVVNHMANKLTFEGAEAGAPFVTHEQEYRLKPRGMSDPSFQPYADYSFNNTWDPNGSYTGEYTFYGRDGLPRTDLGAGTHSASDFHHNGDLNCYEDAFCINLGKIYGIMDDLRTESPRVQAKHVAAAKALIESADVDGFRIDTPMQVDLSFFKAWAPEIKRFAREALNKTNFGMWGEFFVQSGRFATMTGRGKEPRMYSNASAFIDGAATLNGGIDYDPYHYFRWMLLRNEIGQFPLNNEHRARFDGLAELWRRDVEQLDTFNPLTGRDENTMWHFCNNHDQWRFSAIDDVNGLALFRVCLGWLSFWPGVPLHYAGDEQGFKTCGARCARRRSSPSTALSTAPFHDPLHSPIHSPSTADIAPLRVFAVMEPHSTAGRARS